MTLQRRVWMIEAVWVVGQEQSWTESEAARRNLSDDGVRGHE